MIQLNVFMLKVIILSFFSILIFLSCKINSCLSINNLFNILKMSRIEVQSYANTNDFKFQFDSLGTTVFNRGIYTINNIKYPKEMLETGNNVVVYIVLDSTCYEKINTK
jgi:hypothetical protein